MESKHLFKWMMAGGLFAATAAACGDDIVIDPPGTGGSGPTSTSSTTTVTTTTTTTSSSVTTGTGGTMDDGNDDCSEAEQVELTVPLGYELQDPKTDSDYFRFDGNAGDQILIQIAAKPEGGDPQDPMYIDSVLTLFDATGDTQIAENDDSFPRFGQDSQLFTILPATGTYCVRVQDFSLWAGNGANATATDGTFEIYVGGINPAILVNESPEPNDTAATATPIVFAGDAANGYDRSIISSGFADGTDVDLYTFTLPADQMVVPGERASTYITFFPAGPEASGSTTFVGRAAILDPETDPPTVIAEMDMTKGGPDLNSVDWEREFFTPLELGKEYQFIVQRPDDMVGTNDFYYFFNFPDVSSYPVETAELENDDLATAEALTVQQNDDGSVSYFVEGNLDTTGPNADVDHFTFDIPPSVSKVSVVCKGWTAGSGLRDLELSVLEGDGTLIQGITENETDSAQLLALDTTGANTTMALKVEATTQSPTVTSTYYRCSVYVYEP